MVRFLTRIVAVAAALLFVAPHSGFAQAQTKATEADKKPQTVKPQMTVGDLAFTLQTLASVNITGAEVEAYVDVKHTFMRVFEQSKKEQKKEADIVVVEMSILTANNFLELFKRANLQGAAAERFLAVKNALYASAPQQNGGK